MSEEKFQFDELIQEYLDKRIEQHKTSLELKQIIRRIYYLKKNFRNKETEEFDLEKGKVKLKKYVSKFSSVLKKDFQKLSNKEKREIFMTGLLRIKFALNFTKYQKHIEQNKKTLVDNYVQERKRTNEFYLNMLSSEKVQKELKDYKKALDDKWKIWDSEIFSNEDELEEFLEHENELTAELMEEIQPDPYYFSDDDPLDMLEVERDEKGYEQEKYSEEDDGIPDDGFFNYKEEDK